MKAAQIADLIQTTHPAATVECAWDVLLILSIRRHGPDARLPRSQPPSATPTWRQVLRLVCEHYDVTELEIMGRNRSARVSQARFALQAVMVERLGLAMREVSKLTKRDWHTVQNGLRALRRGSAQWQALGAALENRGSAQLATHFASAIVEI
jgi:hypothetical protein